MKNSHIALIVSQTPRSRWYNGENIETVRNGQEGLNDLNLRVN